MPHVRTSIRDAAEAALAALVTPQTVAVERRFPFDIASLPAVNITLMGSEAQPDQTAMGNIYDVETDEALTIEIHAGGMDAKTVCEQIDQIELEIESALAVDVTLGGIVENLVPNGSAFEGSVDQELFLGSRAVSYIAIWRHKFGAADQPEG